MKCTNCGAELKEGAKFCVKCGSPVTNNVVVQNPVEQNPVVQSQVSTPKSNNKLAIIVVVMVVVLCILGTVLVLLLKNYIGSRDDSEKRDRKSISKEYDDDDEDEEEEEDAVAEAHEVNDDDANERKVLDISTEEFVKEAKKQIDEYAQNGSMSVKSDCIMNSGTNIYFTLLGPEQPDVKREMYDGSVAMKDSYFEVVCVDPYGDMQVLDRIELADPHAEDDMDDKDIDSANIIKIGDTEQYVVTLSGMEYEKQYKYGLKGDRVEKLDDEMLFTVINGTVYCQQRREWGNYNSSLELVEITFEDGEYKQYGCEEVNVYELINIYPELDRIMEDLQDETECLDIISLSEYEGTSVIVQQADFLNAMKSANGKIYLTYSFCAEDYYMEDVIYNMNVYYTFREENGTLVREQPVNFTSKEATMNLPLKVIK